MTSDSRQWQPPRLRLFEQAHRRATWLELLYDLVFVVAVAELADVLAGGGLLAYVGLFVPVWWAWAGYVFYANRFDTDDVSHRLLALPQILAVAAMAASVGDLEERSGLFAVAYVAARLLLVVAYLRAGRHVPEARPLTVRYAAGFAVAALGWLASLAVEPPQRYAFWAVAMVVDLATPLLTRRHQGKLPPQTEHLPERFGLFVVIVLGEVVAAVVTGLKGHAVTPGTLAIALAGVAIAMGFWWLYFGHIDESVVLRTRLAGQVWVYSHLPLSLGLVAYGIGIEHVLAHPGGTSWAVGLPAALVLAVLGVQHLCSGDRRAAVLRLAAAALTLATAALPTAAALPLILAYAAAQVGHDLLRPRPAAAEGAA
ncbi:low temperature requirement protein A [Actinomadura sp. ATCC 31491]|uniref:Low temperature requirement protein A n=1 Tax=Actinomadura luzonensis TaxID=2805427 RepID=A0ABT0FJN9_9ACTN|nr:low temperature requirement protein A [Actinomadura luzonensis]MCK2212539.1 low temperature requirement protein A [Actinomadura luzonensis]